MDFARFSRGKFLSAHDDVSSWEEALERHAWLEDFGAEDGELASVIQGKGWRVSEPWTVSAGEPLPHYRHYKDDAKEEERVRKMGDARLSYQEVLRIKASVEERKYQFGADAKIEDFCIAKDMDGAVWIYQTTKPEDVRKNSDDVWYLSGDKQTKVVDREDAEKENLFKMLHWSDALPALVRDLLIGKQSPAGGKLESGTWDEFFCTSSTEERARMFTNWFGACVGQFTDKYPEDCEALGCKQCWINLLKSAKTV